MIFSFILDGNTPVFVTVHQHTQKQEKSCLYTKLYIFIHLPTAITVRMYSLPLGLLITILISLAPDCMLPPSPSFLPHVDTHTNPLLLSVLLMKVNHHHLHFGVYTLPCMLSSPFTIACTPIPSVVLSC